MKKIILALLVGIFCSPFVYANCPDPSKIDIKNPKNGIKSEDGIWTYFDIFGPSSNLKRVIFLSADAFKLNGEDSPTNPFSTQVNCTYVDPDTGVQIAFSSPGAKIYQIDNSSHKWKNMDHHSLSCMRSLVKECPFSLTSK